MALKEFDKASGSSAAKAPGHVRGKLLGVVVNTIDKAIDAFGDLAQGKPDSFMAKAVEAAKITVQRLDAKLTIPFASPETDFSGSLKSAFSSGVRKGYTAQRKAVPVPKASGPKLAPT